MVNRLIFVSFIIFFGVFSLHSDPTLNIYANKKSPSLNEYFQISVEIQNASGGVSFQEVKNLSDYIDLAQTGNMSSFSIVNGAMTSSQTIIFTVQIAKEGQYEIGPFVFSIGGKTYETDTISVEVNSSKSTSEEDKRETNDDNDKNNDSESNANKDYSKGVSDFQGYSTTNNNLNYLIKATFSKKEVYINDYVDAEVRLFARDELQVTNYEPLKFPTQAWTENYELKTNYIGRTRINGLIYSEYLIEKKRFYISKEGSYTVEPAILNFNGLTGRGFFSYPERMSLSTKGEKIVVKPLPEAKDSNFYGLVGDFSYTSSLSTSSIKEKDATTLTIKVGGNGNMQNLKDIKYKIDGKGLEVYSSKSNVVDSGGTKTKIWEVLLVGQKVGKYKIELENLTFFNPETASYKTIKGGSFNLTVIESDKVKDDTTVVIHSDNKDAKNEGQVDISYIKLNLGNKRGLYNYNLILKLIIVLYALLGVTLVLFVIVKFSIYLSHKNSSYIKSKNAYKNFVTHIKKIEKTVNRSFNEKIIGNISFVTESYFIDKFGMDSVKFTKSSIKEELESFVDKERVTDLIKFFSDLDFARFGGIDISKERVLELIKNISDIVKKIDTIGEIKN